LTFFPNLTDTSKEELSEETTCSTNLILDAVKKDKTMKKLSIMTFINNLYISASVCNKRAMMALDRSPVYRHPERGQFKPQGCFTMLSFNNTHLMKNNDLPQQGQF
jgi:hypothetical protein